ncbi:sigma-54-dependent Fis family transcriptional regulator [Billgrantia saliphila]|uniref:sigma-54-dependent Fis family transcriptional regulator n=1 Tax=Billgrantia saliphila TaxID=1848458 RepID=UPI000CE42CAB|nr:sigma 54-interacting transcriptional regulator [Halomonas saliphila]
MYNKAALRTPGVMRQAHQQIRAGTLPVDLLDASIGRSWQRCLEYGLLDGKIDFPRITRAELREQCLANRRLVELAEPMVKRVADDLGSQLLLASPDATVLKTYGKQFSIDGRLRIEPGMNLDERWFGTNAPALALIERAPVLVNANEHLLFPDNPVSCVAAPLYGLNEECLGLLDLTFDARHPRPELFLRRVKQLTCAIGQQLFRRQYQHRWVLQVHASMAELDSETCGLVAINDEGFILAADKSARQWLNYNGAMQVGGHVEELLGCPWSVMRRQCERQSALLGIELAELQLVGRLNAPDGWQPAEVGVVPQRRDVNRPQIAVQVPTLMTLTQGWCQEQQREAIRASRALKAGLPVLLQGETGTGKEQLARALHQQAETQGAFVALNCASIPENLIEAELFGYGEGAFTGARKGGHAGRLVQASGGTLLLDEIGDMPQSLQARLLRVMQERVVVPLGDHREIPIDIRVIAATHRDLEELVRKGEFREDLYFRLAGVVVELPALSKQADVASRIEELWYRLCLRHERQLPLDDRLLSHLAAYPWPGNWRELEYCLQAAIVGAEPELVSLTLSDLSPRWQRKLTRRVHAPVDSQQGDARSLDAVVAEDEAAPRSLKALEREHIERTLEAHDGNFTAAARALGVSRSTLYRRLG